MSSIKKRFSILAAVLAGVLLLSACTAAAAGNGSSTPQPTEQPVSTPPADSSEPQEAGEQVYRGRVDSVAEDGSITVSQLPGYDYGQPTIVFHIGEETQVDNAFDEILEDYFVEVHYSGALTRSMPPQGTATQVTVIASFSEGIVVNGEIRAVEETEEGYRIDLLPVGAEEDTRENYVVLMVPKTALENLAAEDLQEGLMVSAVTTGIATMSLPPQMPVVALMPYTAGEAEPMTAVVLESSDGNLLLYTTQGDNYAGDLLSTSIQPETEILNAEGESATESDIVPGALVRLTFDGLVQEIYPPVYTGLVRLEVLGEAESELYTIAQERWEEWNAQAGSMAE